MTLSPQMRRLEARWQSGSGWPQRLNWIEISGVRGWEGQRFDLKFPIMAVVGENGAGKSTVIQTAASVYASPDASAQRKERFASDFFPETYWDQIRNARLGYEVRQGDNTVADEVSKRTDRWRRNPERRVRPVQYIDLSRIQPVLARTGYTKLSKPTVVETDVEAFGASSLERFSHIMGREYDGAQLSTTDVDPNRRVPVISQQGRSYSGFHQGAGETTVVELLEQPIPKYALVLIDEVESSLHPRAQRRLIRDLADRCRELELQVILTTHSPYILQELPLDARAYILQPPGGKRQFVYGVSPEFAMSKMDDLAHSECDLYVEDERAATMLAEILVSSAPDLVPRCRTIPAGAASVLRSLGQMVHESRFPRPTCVFLDGDQGEAPGCNVLPGDDPPERVVFEALKRRAWKGLDVRLDREYPRVVDACEKTMTLPDHHVWLTQVGTSLTLGAETLWQAMCALWVREVLPEKEARSIAQKIEDVLIGVASYKEEPPPLGPAPPRQQPPKDLSSLARPRQDEQLFNA